MEEGLCLPRASDKETQEWVWAEILKGHDGLGPSPPLQLLADILKCSCLPGVLWTGPLPGHLYPGARLLTQHLEQAPGSTLGMDGWVVGGWASQQRLEGE